MSGTFDMNVENCTTGLRMHCVGQEFFDEESLLAVYVEYVRFGASDGAMIYSDDQVRASMPVCFIEICAGVFRRVVRMRVVEADDLHLNIACVTLHRYEFRGVDRVTRFRHWMHIATRHHMEYASMFSFPHSQQYSATLIRVGIECMPAKDRERSGIDV
jgi:hypothetical protein